MEVAAGLLPRRREVLHKGDILIDIGRSKRPKSAFGLTLQSDGCVETCVSKSIFSMPLTLGGRIDVDPWLERYNLRHQLLI